MTLSLTNKEKRGKRNSERERKRERERERERERDTKRKRKKTGRLHSHYRDPNNCQVLLTFLQISQVIQIKKENFQKDYTFRMISIL